MKGKQIFLFLFLTAMLCVGGFLVYQEMDARVIPPILEQSVGDSHVDDTSDMPGVTLETKLDMAGQDDLGQEDADEIQVWPQLPMPAISADIAEVEEISASRNAESEPSVRYMDDIMDASNEDEELLQWDDFDDMTATSRTGSSEYWMMEVKTAKRSKSFRVRSGVDTSTLKRHVGWMESSARPGDDGICIIMGHRDDDLRILKEVGMGDAITITDQQGNKVVYYTRHAEIIGKNDSMSMPMTDEKTLILLTCYPFHVRP